MPISCVHGRILDECKIFPYIVCSRSLLIIKALLKVKKLNVLYPHSFFFLKCFSGFCQVIVFHIFTSKESCIFNVYVSIIDISVSAIMR